jgi:hypothetical protein
MRPTVVIASTLPLIAALTACGGSLWPTSKIQIKAYGPDVFACVNSAASDLGYHPFLSDTLHHVYEGRRESKQKSFVEVDQFGAIDRVKARVEAPKTGGTATLIIQGQSVSVHETKEGVLDEPEPASPEVTHDVQKIAAKCAPSTAVTSS